MTQSLVLLVLRKYIFMSLEHKSCSVSAKKLSSSSSACLQFCWERQLYQAVMHTAIWRKTIQRPYKRKLLTRLFISSSSGWSGMSLTTIKERISRYIFDDAVFFCLVNKVMTWENILVCGRTASFCWAHLHFTTTCTLLLVSKISASGIFRNSVKSNVGPHIAVRPIAAEALNVLGGLPKIRWERYDCSIKLHV